MIGVLTLAVLFVDLLQDGYARLNWDFFTSFPSRRAEPGRHPLGLVGTSLVMLLTRDRGRAAGRRGRRLPRGIRAEATG
jgi:hypothetical protein